MSYLQPPQNSSPVVVVKDVGGYVNEYAAMTDFYRRTNREVRLHECRSACTMALSLPNVCVYPDSLLKFHQAYDPRNHVTNWAATEALFQTYPEAVRLRLGTPTKQYTVLRGSELIELGIRNCNEPGPRIMIAQASIKPIPQGMFSGESGLSGLTGKLEGMLPNLTGGRSPSGENAPPPRRAVPMTADMLTPEGPKPAVPLPPERPAEVLTATLEHAAPDAAEPGPADERSGAREVQTAGSGITAPPPPLGGIPLPPPRPPVLVAYAPVLAPIPLSTPIAGSYPVLPTRFTPFRKWTG